MEVDDDPVDSVQCTWYFNQSLLQLLKALESQETGIYPIFKDSDI